MLTYTYTCRYTIHGSYDLSIFTVEVSNVNLYL
jgi:hypothetical protein